jgi:hypothetical protein
MSKYTDEDVKKYCAIQKVALFFKVTIKGEISYSKVGIAADDAAMTLPKGEDFETLVETSKDELLKFASSFDKTATAELCTPEEYFENDNNDDEEEEEDE